MYFEQYRWQDRVIRPYWLTVDLGITLFAFALLGGASLLEAPVGRDVPQIERAGFSFPAIPDPRAAQATCSEPLGHRRA